jgi:Tol biopolymer transport system component
VIGLPSGQEVRTFSGYASYLAAGNGPTAFSPNGGSVLMQTDFCKPPTWSLDVAGVDGSVRTIAQGSFMVTKFSPDGSLVAYTSGTQLWVVASDGSSAPRRLATGVHGPAGFEWSPDSRWISVPPFFGGFDQCN